MSTYDHKKIESKWQQVWEDSNIYAALDDSEKENYYCLIEFPYPSGDGLHTGHIRSNTAMDIIARKRRMEGYNVLYPMGWDAFGLPTENFAIKHGIHPKEVTKKNTDTFRRQLKSVGFSFDWSREINTTDPAYYKWTQWIFLKMYEEGLAYKAKIHINWCISCKIGLANEEVVNGLCERCGGETEKREKEQWMLAITKYAQRLLDDLDDVDYLEKIKTQQRNWIGRSEGAEIDFKIVGDDKAIKVFTTRPDTLFGSTYVVIAPDHSLVEELKGTINNWSEVSDYRAESKKQKDIERTAEGKEKTGVKLEGVMAINPANGKEVPVYVADYVLATYGTGSIMAVPAHDERDFAFAKKYDIPVIPVIDGGEDMTLPYSGSGLLIHSGTFNGLEGDEAKKAITEDVSGVSTVTYKLRDWVFSRQRYWGEPIPMVECHDCGVVPVPESELPVELPDVARYEPTDTGESPLAGIESWVNVACPACGKDARRETDTMPNWAGSSWYFLRYIDPHSDDVLIDPTKDKKWMPVDWYNGGMEHTTLHLLYSRFWHKFLYDIGVVHTKEPYQKRTSHGMILAEGGVKMSKSIGNVVNPDEIVSTYGADTLRVYEMFMGPFDQSIGWDPKSIIGARRFIEKVWRLQDFIVEDTVASLDTDIHKALKKVSEDIEEMKFNTAISTMMTLASTIENKEEIGKSQYELLILMLAPFAPHAAEELWLILGHKNSIHQHAWPSYDEKLLVDNEMIIVVQVNGKVRDRLVLVVGLSEDEVIAAAKEQPKIQAWIDSKTIKKAIYVPGKLVSFVV